MAAILNSAILDSAILVSAISFQTNSLTHTCQDWYCSHFGFILHKKNFTHSFWLNLMMAAILNSAMFNLASLDSAILVQKELLSLIHSTWLMARSSWIQPFFIKIKLYSFILTQLDDGSNLILNSAILDSAILHKKKLHLFILTQFDDGSHLEFCHVGFRHCHLGLRHFVIFSQIYSKTLSLHSDSDSN